MLSCQDSSSGSVARTTVPVLDADCPRCKRSRRSVKSVQGELPHPGAPKRVGVGVVASRDHSEFPPTADLQLQRETQKLSRPYKGQDTQIHLSGTVFVAAAFTQSICFFGQQCEGFHSSDFHSTGFAPARKATLQALIGTIRGCEFMDGCIKPADLGGGCVPRLVVKLADGHTVHLTNVFFCSCDCWLLEFQH